ncbi:MAG: EpsI family protein [Gemmataceae bacterium]
MSTSLTAGPTTTRVDRRPPTGIYAAWSLVALGTAAFAVVMQAVWAATPDMNDRFLIPCASGWVIHRLLPRWRATTSNPSWLGLALVGLGSAAFVPGWYLLVQVGPRVILLWWLLASLVSAALGVAVLHFGWSRARLLVFPLLFCFLALPVPGMLYTPLQRGLQECTTQVAARVLPYLGIPVVRHGFVLTLPTGDLGVVEACSGVRSVTALAAIAILVAYLRGFSVVRGTVLFVLTFAIVAISNAVRVIVTGLLREYVSPEAAEGWRHEVLGISVILTGLALIVWVSKLIAPRAKATDSLPLVEVPASPVVGGFAATVLLAFGLAGCLWAEQFRQSHREVVRLEELPQHLDGWTSREIPIDPMVAEMLKCDELLYRVYTNRVGQDVHVYVMFWATPASTAHMHHPDICWPYRGFQPVEKHVRPVPYSGGSASIPISVRMYARGNERQMVFYWSQNANVLMPDGKELSENVSEYAWLVSMLQGRQSLQRVARMSVLLATELATSPEQQEKTMEGLAGGLADALYKQCPWARPE